MTPSALLAIAEEAARAAGRVLVAKLDEARTIEFKGGTRSNLVTDADHASEAVVLDVLRRHVPGHAIVAEESGSLGTNEYTWFIDPLDGTTNYAHAVPHFCVTLAVEGPTADGAIALQAGVVFDPLRDELFAAARGQGATLNGRPLRASATEHLEGALLCTGFPYDVQQKPEGPLGLFNRLVRRAQGMRRMGSAALDLAYVAAGRFDGFFEFGLKPWDTAAGALLITEAQGRVARIDGALYEPRFGDVLAASPRLFDELAREAKTFLGSFAWQPQRYDAGP